MKLDPKLCKAITTPRNGSHQCKWKATINGFCGHHTPVAFKRRKQAVEERQSKERYNSTQGRLNRAMMELNALKQEGIDRMREEFLNPTARKGQSKTMSAVENVCSVASGFVIAMLLWRFVVTPYLGIPVSYGTNFNVIALFTVASIIRGYIWRRVFNGAWRKEK